MTNIFIDDFCNKFDGITKKPEKFLSAPKKLIDNVKELIKETYDFTKKEEITPISDSLPELIIDDFDVEQIWQQIELQNESILTEYLSSVSKLVAAKERLWFINNNNDESDQDISEQEEIDEKIDADNVDSVGSENEEHEKSENEEQEESENEEHEESENEEHEQVENSEDNLSEKDASHPVGTKTSKQKNKSIVDDDFFKLEEMEQFLKKEEQQSDKKQSDDSDDEESVDLFENNSEDEDDDSEENSDSEMNPKYDAFFVESKPTENKKRKKNFAEESGSEEENEDEEQTENKKRKVRFEEGMEDENEDEEQTENIKRKVGFEEGIEDENEEMQNEIKNVKSSLELRDERLRRKIENIEELALEDKPWQLKGEVTADKRPQNSLLEEIVDFDLTVRPAPVITEETTMKLEDVIKQRIKDKVWDDVERKTKLVESPFEYKKKLLLDQEKSKESLAQIYEDEYLKQQESLDPNSADKPEEEPKLHIEIKSMMKSLFGKLDALSNFHFTPKTVAPELRIVSNLPAINMEEVAPVATSDAALLAPEEIKKKTKGDEIGKAERTDTDKNRERRHKKQKQREHAKVKKQKEKLIEKMKPGLGNKYSKQKTAKLLEKVTKDRNVDKMDESVGNKSLKSSTAFFSQLQDEVRGQIKSKIATQNKKSKQIFTAKKLKL